jgi:hypothetical protein
VKAKYKKALTEFAVRNTTAKDGHYIDLIDTKAPGLLLRIQPTGHRAYKFRSPRNGPSDYYHIGWVCLSDARKIAFQLQADVAAGRDPIAERRSKVLQRNNSFADVHARYLTECAQKKNKSWRQADALIKAQRFP